MGKRAKKPVKAMAVVTWNDAHADFSGSWVQESDIDPEGLKVTSLGIVLDGVKPGHISLAQSYAYGLCDHVLHIPDNMVTDITIIGTIDTGEEYRQ
jgi:hypothetical protein